MGADLLARMKPTAFFIFTARGPIVDQTALIEVLTEGRIAGAGLDVFEDEPLAAENPLTKMDNVILHPMPSVGRINASGVLVRRMSGPSSTSCTDVSQSES